MLNLPTALQRQLQTWRSEHVRVVDTASAINLIRVRWLTQTVAVLNLLHVVVLSVQIAGNPAPASPLAHWQVAMALSHLAMGVLMATGAVAAYQLRHTSRLLRGQVLPLVIALVGMGFGVTLAAIDQWITPSITPFLIACVLTGLAIYLRPMPSAVLYALSFVAIYLALGVTQHDAALLWPNRISALVACALGWALSVLLWRKFTIITLQQAQLDAAHAALQDKQRDLERLTRNDGLTGLFNRNTFTELAKRELHRAQRQGTATAILLLDLDHFKNINDTWGHPAGDAVLKMVASTAGRTVRSTDLVGRLGGEEFIVLLPSTSVEAARRLAEKLRNQLQSTPTLWEKTRIPATASIGVAGTTANDNLDFDTLYREADKALYVAKTQGRNRVV